MTAVIAEQLANNESLVYVGEDVKHGGCKLMLGLECVGGIKEELFLFFQLV